SGCHDRSHGPTRAKFYGCAYHHKRGRTICANGLQIRQERLDQAVLDALATVLDQPLIEEAVAEAVVRIPREDDQRLRRPGPSSRASCRSWTPASAISWTPSRGGSGRTSSSEHSRRRGTGSRPSWPSSPGWTTSPGSFPWTPGSWPWTSRLSPSTSRRSSRST